MANLAFNPDTKQAVVLKDNEWVATDVAEHPITGEIVALNENNEWQTVVEPTPTAMEADPLDESGEYARLTRGRISSDTLSQIQPRTKDLGKEAYEKAVKEEESKTVSALANNKEWIKNAKIIWNQENPGVEFDPEAEGYDSIADWFMDRHSRLGNDLTNLGMTAFKIGDMTKEQQQAWSDSLEQFEVADSDMKSFLRAVKNAALAPETIIGLVGTLGVGALAKLIGGKAATTAAKLSFKKQLVEQLTKRNIVDKTVKEVGKDTVVKKTVKEVTDDQLKKSAAKALRAKQVGAGAVAGGIYGGGFDVGTQIISAPDAPVDVQKAAISTGIGAVSGGVLGRLLPVGREAENVAQAVRKNLDEAPSTENVKLKTLKEDVDVVDPEAPVRSKITERLATLNTKAGRFLSSNASLPKELFNAALKRERGSGTGLDIKRSINKLDKALKEDTAQRIKNKEEVRITNEDINLYFDEGTVAPSLQGTKVLEALEEVGKNISANEDKLNKVLGLKGKKKLGVNRDKGKFYITRSFEAVNNPAYLEKIREAVSAGVDETKRAKVDADFLAKVDGAREAIRKVSPNMKAENVDDTIVHMVRRLSGETESKDFLLDIPKLLGDLAPREGSNLLRAKNSLRRRKELDQPILNLLGERKDAVGRLAETLTTQQKLIRSAEYFSELDQFAKQALQKSDSDTATIELGGLIDFLPKQRVVLKQKVTPKGEKRIPPSDAEGDLSNLVSQQLGEGIKNSGVFLKDIYTSPKFYDYFDKGVDYFSNSQLGGGFIGSGLANIAAYGQATQTVLDLPAYIINSLGALQNLGTNGYILSAIGKDNLVDKAAKDVLQMYTLESKESLGRLAKLKEQGVVDSDLSSEIIRKNINLYGKDLTNPFAKAYKKGMENLSQAYGVPDTYAKLIAHELEYRTLKKMYGDKVPDDELFEMASQIVRDVMPSYSVASPGARMLSRLPIGTYALFPSEMVRTTKNIIKYSVMDLVKGANEMRKGNVKLGGQLMGRGARRSAGLAAATVGLESYVNSNNELLTDIVDEERTAAEQAKINERVLERVGGSWTRGGKPYILEGAKEDKNGNIIIRYANSAQYDAMDFNKVATRLVGRVLGGDNLTEVEVEDAVKGLGASIMGPYLSPKFVVDGLINIAASALGHGDLFSEEQPGINAENIKRAVVELAESLEPGTSQAIRAYIDTLAASEVQDVALNSYGFPLTMNDMNNWLTTGQRTTTNDLNKSIGYTVYKKMRQLDLSDKSFETYLKQIKPQQMTPEIVKDIITKYKDSMEVKRKNYKNLQDEMKLFSEFSYEGVDGESKKLGVGGVLRAVAGPNGRYERNSEKASEIMLSPFIDMVNNPVDNDNLVFLLQEKFGDYNPTGIMGELAKAYQEEILKSQQGEE